MSDALVLSSDERAVRGTSSPVMGMVLFVAGEAMFFASFFGAYASIFASAAVWPPQRIPIPDLPIPSTLTGILVLSSIVLQLGVWAVRRGRLVTFERLLGLTVLLGLCFLALQAYDYSQLTFGIKDGIYPSLFFVMTGLHMAHVAGGVALLSVILSQTLTGQVSQARHDSVEAAAIYWHFVDVVWIGLFCVFYLAAQG
ncbi:MAG: heme-copper oxidase subunit III [Candidatus Velamenicoccus archaeovorus]